MLDLVHWQIFFVLLAAGFVGAESVRPLNQSVLKLSESRSPVSTKHSRAVHWAICTAIYLAVLSLSIISGLILTLHLGSSGAPLVEGTLKGVANFSQRNTIILPVLTGLVLGAVISPLALYQPR